MSESKAKRLQVNSWSWTSWSKQLTTAMSCCSRSVCLGRNQFRVEHPVLRVLERMKIIPATGRGDCGIHREAIDHLTPCETEIYRLFMCFPGASLEAQTVENLPVKQATWFNRWVGRIPWRGEWQPTPVFLPGKSHGQRSLAGYRHWVCREMDGRDWALMHAFMMTLYMWITIKGTQWGWNCLTHYPTVAHRISPLMTYPLGLQCLRSRKLKGSLPHHDKCSQWPQWHIKYSCGFQRLMLDRELLSKAKFQIKFYGLCFSYA